MIKYGQLSHAVLITSEISIPICWFEQQVTHRHRRHSEVTLSCNIINTSSPIVQVGKTSVYITAEATVQIHEEIERRAQESNQRLTAPLNPFNVPMYDILKWIIIYNSKKLLIIIIIYSINAFNVIIIFTEVRSTHDRSTKLI